MQQRHTDREVYFHELAQTSERYFIPYVERVVTLSSSARVLEVGCGEGGNLVPFARRGCAVTGVDRAAVRVAEAQSFFSAAGLEGHFEAADIFNWAAPAAAYDVILLHDVVEHVPDKAGLLCILRRLIRPGGGVVRGLSFVAHALWWAPADSAERVRGPLPVPSSPAPPVLCGPPAPVRDAGLRDGTAFHPCLSLYGAPLRA